MNTDGGGPRILGDLRRVLDRADPVPDRVLAGARMLFALRSLDDDYAELVRRSGRQEPRG